MLTGKQLVEQKIITGDIPEVNVQQHGVDLNLVDVFKVDGGNEEGIVPNDIPGLDGMLRKTKLALRYREYMHNQGVSNSSPYWFLAPGVYDIVLQQGCKVPPNQKMKIVHRSSLFRNGAEINSALFDAGFETNQIGTMMRVATPIKIEVGARVAQAHVYQSNVVDNLYNGQWQGDIQRSQQNAPSPDGPGDELG